MKCLPRLIFLAEAAKKVENEGIVFLDEIDKLIGDKRFGGYSPDASAEGVQRDLLPLIEGTTTSTKAGMVQTDNILFIASGAFNRVKPSDLLPELQGRLPLRVELKGLTETDFYHILTSSHMNALEQAKHLLSTENVSVNITDGALREIARVTSLANQQLENIGARRLNTIVERVLNEISFTAANEPKGTVYTVDENLVKKNVSDLVKENKDLLKFIL